MAIQFLIGGVDRTTAISFDSVSASNTIARKGDTCSFVLTVHNADFPRPLGGQEFVWLNGATREFAGTILKVREVQLGPLTYEYHCVARDFTYLLDRRLVVEDYVAQRADLIVADVVTRFTSGFTIANVRVAYAVPEQKYDYVYPSEIIDGLASSLEWGWYCDYNRDIHFFGLEIENAPVSSVDLDSDTGSLGDVTLEEDVTQVKNRIYLKGFKTKSSGTYTREFTGDGTTKFFHLGYEPSSIAETTVLVSGAARTVKTDMVDSIPGDTTGTDAYVCFTNMGVRFNTAPASGAPVAATFPYMHEDLTVVESADSQTEMKAREGGDGIHEYVVSDPSLTAPTVDPATARGNLLLVKYGWPTIQGEGISRLTGWRAGQNFHMQSARRFKDRNGVPISVRMYVHSVEKSIETSTDTEVRVLSKVAFGDSPFVI